MDYGVMWQITCPLRLLSQIISFIIHSTHSPASATVHR